MTLLRKATRKLSLTDKSEFLPVKGFEGLYMIHWRGVVYSLITNKLLQAGIAGNGYLTVSLSHKTHTIHSLVAGAFVSGRFDGSIINHKDGDKRNNHFANLEWTTYGYNNSHAIQNGLRQSAYAARGVIQIDLEGNEVARYHSSEHAPKPFSSGNICHVCNGKRLTHGGYKWQWINNNNNK